MTATGKRARMMSGLNRFGCHKAKHARKSREKIKRAGWVGERKEHGK